MPLHDDLLALATDLADMDNRACSRRSISTAYYALFHRLAFESASLFFPLASDEPLRAATVRALDHRTMKQVCQWFSGSATYNRQVAGLLGPSVVPGSLKTVSRAFILLQDARHDADYNIVSHVTSVEASKSCAEARIAFEALDSGSGDPVFRLFLGSLLFSNSWRA